METYSSSNSQEIENNQLINTHSILDSDSMVFSTADLNSGNFQGKLDFFDFFFRIFAYGRLPRRNCVTIFGP